MVAAISASSLLRGQTSGGGEIGNRSKVTLRKKGPERII